VAADADDAALAPFVELLLAPLAATLSFELELLEV
jgi:hypothetical protein